MRVTVTKVSQRHAECMSCGKEGCRFRDWDGSPFCSQRCISDWHGDDGWMPRSQITIADVEFAHAMAIAENYSRSLNNN